MSDRASNSTGGGTPGPGGAASGSSLVQIGHYVLGETLGIGTFGKVKGTNTNLKCSRKICHC